MKPYSELETRGQVGRLRRLATAALTAYDLGPARLALLSHQDATIFRVDTERGDRYTLRIYNPAFFAPASVEPPLAWLAALGRDTDLLVPAPIPARDGRLLVESTVAGVPDARLCVLSRWVGGRFRNRSLVPAHLEAVGRVMARLHCHAETFTPPSTTRPTWEWDWEFGDRSVFASGPDAVPMDDADRAILLAVEAPLRVATAQLGTGPGVCGIIHADFHQWNYLFLGDQVGIIDFGDCGHGYYLYDMAQAVLNLSETRSPDVPALRAALLAGYRQVRRLPAEEEGLLDLFVAARFVDLLNWMGHLDSPQMRERAPRLAATAARRVRELPLA
jgi:Ser/Thr protein kinase RdoA (MazF antagonist)